MVVAERVQMDPGSWWAALKHGGLLVAPSRLGEFFVPQLDPLSSWVEERLRRDVTQCLEGETASLGTLLDTVLEQVLGLEGWIKGSQVGREWGRQVITREWVKPRRVWQHAGGTVLPVFVAEDLESGGCDKSPLARTRLGVGRGKRAVSRVIEWLRRANLPIGVLTNGIQWRLIHAGSDYDAWCEWDINLWFEEGTAGIQVLALRLLLGRQALVAEPGTPCTLLAAIQASRQGEAELSEVLGERVRQAVEVLIREAGIGAEAGNPKDLYIAATRMMMRCVVILFAEARDLLPRDNPIYHNSYGIQGLREQLDRMAGGRVSERLRRQYGAWGRLLGLFRLVYWGCPHQALLVPRYGGGLFEPGNPQSVDPVSRALAVLEDPKRAISDAAVYRILELLCRSKVRVRQGRGSTWVEAPVDFSDLSSEYIGILYEGLLDFELRRAAEVTVFLNLGDQPALPLSRLEQMSEKALESLLEKLKKAAKPSLSDDGGEDEAEAEDDEEREEIEDEDEEATELEPEVRDPDAGVLDLAQELRERVQAWGIRAVQAGKLVAKPRSKQQEALAEYERQVAAMAERLIARVLLPGEWFLVRWGGTRKGSGTFYTRPLLTVPTVRRTLEPLVYEGGVVRSPADLLALKICDPACGSGSFLVAALRYMTDALWSSLFVHGWLVQEGEEIRTGIPSTAQPEWFVECVKNLPLATEKAEDYSKPRLKRYVVERCVYGVDINPLAVELARLSLWVETMDPSLPFGFLDHKIKCGNALVGCWFDQFQDYPVMAWERIAGDENHKGTLPAGVLTKRIKELRSGRVKEELRELLTGSVQLSFLENRLSQKPEMTHQQARQLIETVHQAVLDPRQQQQEYAKVREETFLQLKWAFDCWCAVWFWQIEDPEVVPSPRQFVDPSDSVRSEVERLSQEYQFFHWELEFPDVFIAKGSGFDAILGNPPWENLQSNPAEFFSNVDPLFRSYGRLESLKKREDLFRTVEGLEREWLLYCGKFKFYANWIKYATVPFGDNERNGKLDFSLGSKSRELHKIWAERRKNRVGYSDPQHPYHSLGGGRVFTYKLFLDLSYSLLKKGGVLGLIVPSSIYSDKFSTSLRKLFVDQCEWLWLFGFENRNKIFNIHRSFKFCPIIIRKGGATKVIKTAFMRQNLSDWENAEQFVIDYPKAQVDKFSPFSKAFLEIRTDRDVEVLDKLYANGVLLGDKSDKGWNIKFALEFMMNTDAKLFPPRPWWESQGYQPDEYGHWLKGNWQPYTGSRSILHRPPGLILSRDGSQGILVDEVEDVALPLYEGRMIGQFDFSKKGWVSGKGRKAIWEETIWTNKQLHPQFMMDIQSFRLSNSFKGQKIGFLAIGSATNMRSMICSSIYDKPCGNAVPVLDTQGTRAENLILSFILNSFTFDFAVRNRFGGINLNYFVISENPLIYPHQVERYNNLLVFAASLTWISSSFSSLWLKYFYHGYSRNSWYQLWALTPYERLRLRCILDAVVAELYGLDIDDFAWILKDCDHPLAQIGNKAFARTLDPKGFWRVDKDRDPELRHTVLAQVAFQDLKTLGLEAFLALNNGEGWMLPDTLRLADYGLGHDERAKEPQPVGERIGEEVNREWASREDQEAPTRHSPLPTNHQYRYYPWQLAQPAADTWEECQRHADNLKRLLGSAPQSTDTVKVGSTSAEPNVQPPTDLFGNPLPTDLFGNVIEERIRKGKR